MRKDQSRRKSVQITDPSLHRAIKMLAAEKGLTIEAIVRSGIEMIVERESAKKINQILPIVAREVLKGPDMG